MSRVTQSHSQLLFTYGPGSMLDLPDHAAIVAGLEDWARGKEIKEPRLTDVLAQLEGERAAAQYPSLHTPPLDEETARGRDAPAVDVRVFPEWFLCDAAPRRDGATSGSAAASVAPSDGVPSGAAGESSETRRRMVRFGEVNIGRGQRLTYSLDGRKVLVSPVRFVAACSKGHLQDIDWRFVVHAGGDKSCRRPMHWVERGVSSDPADIAVRCECGSRVTLSELYQPDRLGTCEGFSPWLTPRRLSGDEGGGCEETLRLLPRAATNAYFPQTLTVISLPEPDDALARTVQAYWATIAGFRDLPEAVDMLRRIPGLREDLRDHADADIRAAIDRQGGDASPREGDGEGGGTEAANARIADPRIEEFDRFTSRDGPIGRDGAGSRLFAERLDRGALVMPERVKALIEGVVRVHRLREVACLYGFTRLEPAPTALESELDDINIQTEGAPLARNVSWFPATEQFGEGIFLHLNPATIADWLGRDAVREHAAILKRGEELDARRRERDAENLGPAYWALHTLSHAFMTELALECGYPLASLKERIYSSKAGQTARYGVLAYTATSGGQGTLGGLSHMAPRAPELLDRALEGIALCSNDPVCGEHRPDDRHDDRHLHGAACHACLLMPETSCEARNGRLDRTFFFNNPTRLA